MEPGILMTIRITYLSVFKVSLGQLVDLLICVSYAKGSHCFFHLLTLPETFQLSKSELNIVGHQVISYFIKITSLLVKFC